LAKSQLSKVTRHGELVGSPREQKGVARHSELGSSPRERCKAYSPQASDDRFTTGLL